VHESQLFKSLSSKQRDVYIQCLLLANHSENDWQWGADIYKCKPGQFICSLDTLAKKCAADVKVQSVRTSLLKLEKWGFLTNESTKTGRLITIINWERYQGHDEDANKQSNKEPTKSQQRANKELTTNKNDKNKKNEKKERSGRFTPPTLDEVIEYCRERGNTVNPNRFIDFYAAKGWLIGKNKMKDWKAAVRTWETKEASETIEIESQEQVQQRLEIEQMMRNNQLS
jgi:hypothetical protein